MFSLRIFLIGMIAFLPMRDAKTLYVLLPQVESHHALLVLDKRDIAPGEAAMANQWSDVAKAIGGAADDNAFGWLLQGVRLEFPDLDGSPLELAVPNLAKSVPVTKEEGVFMSWVPSLQDVFPQIDATVDPSLLTAPSKERLSALLTLKHGKVATYNIGDLANFASSSADPNDKAIDGSRALTEIVVVEIPISGPSISFSRIPFSRGKGSTLTLRPRSGRKTVDILLANLIPSSQADPRKRSGPLRFVRYYDILKAPHEDFWRLYFELVKPELASQAPVPVYVGSFGLVALSQRKIFERRSHDFRLESEHGYWTGRKEVCEPVVIEKPWRLERNQSILMAPPAWQDHAGFGEPTQLSDSGFCVPLWAQGYSGVRALGVTIDVGSKGVISGGVSYGVVREEEVANDLDVQSGEIAKGVPLRIKLPDPTGTYELRLKLADGREIVSRQTQREPGVVIDWDRHSGVVNLSVD